MNAETRQVNVLGSSSVSAATGSAGIPAGEPHRSQRLRHTRARSNTPALARVESSNDGRLGMVTVGGVLLHFFRRSQRPNSPAAAETRRGVTTPHLLRVSLPSAMSKNHARAFSAAGGKSAAIQAPFPVRFQYQVFPELLDQVAPREVGLGSRGHPVAKEQGGHVERQQVD